MKTTKTEWTMEEQSRLANTLTLLLAVWLLISPFILGFANDTAALNNSLFVGAIVALLATVRRMGKLYDTEWASWTAVLFGIWLLFAPFVIGFADIAVALANNVVVGILLCITAAWSGSTTEVASRKWI